MLFNGFQPLFAALDPKQINALSYEIVQIFQNQGGTVDDLVAHTASLTNALADRDHVIGAVIDNLTQVLKTVNARRSGLSTIVVTLQQLVSGLAQDRGAIGSAVTSLAGLSTSVSGLLRASRPALRRSIASLGALSANLADNGPTVERALRNAAHEAQPGGPDRVVRFVGQQLPLLDHRTDPGARRLLRRCRRAARRSEVSGADGDALVQRTQSGHHRRGRLDRRRSR